MKKEFNIIKKFKTEIMLTILLLFLFFSLIMKLQVIFIACLIILVLIVFNDFLLKALLYFKTIEAGSHGFKLTPNPEEIKKAITKSNVSDKAKEELEKPENVNALVKSFEAALLDSAKNELLKHMKRHRISMEQEQEILREINELTEINGGKSKKAGKT